MNVILQKVLSKCPFACMHLEKAAKQIQKVYTQIEKVDTSFSASIRLCLNEVKHYYVFSMIIRKFILVGAQADACVTYGFQAFF